MPRGKPTKEQLEAAQVDLKPEWDAILAAATKMIGDVAVLSTAGQKQAICQLTAIWIKSIYRDDIETSLELSKAFHEQVDVYLTAKRGTVN